MDVVPTQLRLGIDPPAGEVFLALHLEGLTVVVEVTSGSSADARRYLSEAGITVRSGHDGSLAFPTAQLGSLGVVDGRCHLSVGPDLGPLVRLARRSDSSGATVELVDGELQLRFWDDGRQQRFPLSDQVVVALCSADLPFVASHGAWEMLESRGGLPHNLGRAAVGHDGFVEIWAARPQLVESLPVPGLFRIAGDRFGVATPYIHDLSEVRGMAFTGAMPRPDVPDPGAMRSLTVPLAAPTYRLCARLVDKVGSWGAGILVAGGGRARRTVTASALEALDAWPALVVCPPWGLWSWWRTITLVGRTVSVRAGTGSDARVTTWMDLAHGGRLEAVASVVLDDLSGQDAVRAVRAGAHHRLAALAGVIRIGVADSWPDDPELGCMIADAVRPGEFDLGGHPLGWRYPLRPAVRAAEHLRAWTITPASGEDVDAVNEAGRFRHSQVRLGVVSGPLQSALNQLGRTGDLDGVIEASSVGTGGHTSPKIALAVEEAQRAVASGQGPVVIWTLSRRAAVLLRSLLAGCSVVVCEPAEAESRLTESAVGEVVVVCGDRPGKLRGAGTVVVMTLAVSFEELDEAVGPSWSDVGPTRVVVLHTPGGIDDRLATWAAGGGSLAAARSEPGRTGWLLAARWQDVEERVAEQVVRGRDLTSRPRILGIDGR
jgi:hypothetical protein